MEEDDDIIQPDRIFKLLKIRDTKENREIVEKVLETSYNFLAYIQPGSKIITSTAIYSKLSNDVVHISSRLKPQDIADSLEKKRIIKFMI